MEESSETLSVLAPAVSTSSAVLLTPGRTRNIAQDMEALRLSRQDNPYLQQVMASRESLIESNMDEFESDDTILMSQEFGSTALDFVEEDPVSLKEMHDHMIRSPPPMNCWPHDSMSFRASSAFDFGADSPVCYSTYSVNSPQEKGVRSPRRCPTTSGRPRSSRSASPRSNDFSICGRPLSLPGESHLRNALGKKSSTVQCEQKFSLLQNPRPRRRADDSEHLVPRADH